MRFLLAVVFLAILFPLQALGEDETFVSVTVTEAQTPDIRVNDERPRFSKFLRTLTITLYTQPEVKEGQFRLQVVTQNGESELTRISRLDAKNVNQHQVSFEIGEDAKVTGIHFHSFSGKAVGITLRPGNGNHESSWATVSMDADGDGYFANFRKAGPASAAWVIVPDCDDNDPDTNPGQTRFFASPGLRGWDRDCDGLVQKLYNQFLPSCPVPQNPLYGSKVNGDLWWKEVPGCGETAPLVGSCILFVNTPTPMYSHSRVQVCR